MQNDINVSDIDRYIYQWFNYKSKLNRLTIVKISYNEYDLFLKPNIPFLEAFPPFYQVEIKLTEQGIFKISSNRRIILYFFVFLTSFLFIIFDIIDGQYFFSFFGIINLLIIIFLKYLGINKIKKIINERLLIYGVDEEKVEMRL